ncbi:MAG TPA: ATP-binding protein [Planctomycetota bacterium]
MIPAALLLALAAGTALGLWLARRRTSTPPAPAPAPEAAEVETARWQKAKEDLSRAVAAETLCRRIIDTTLDGVAVLDGRYVIEQWNPQAAAIFGWSKDEAIGQPLLKLAVAESARDELHRVISGRARPSDTPLFSRRTEIRGLRKNGQEFPLEIAVTPLLQPEKGVAYSVFLRDITERKRVDRLKNEFVATVSHELRTPLTSIRGSLRLIAGGFTGELPAKTRAMIDIANESCERLVALVNDILDIEKIESGKMSFALLPHDMTALAMKAVEATRAFAQPFGVEIRTEAPAGPCPAVVDADRIIQVITNLVSNAVKFSPKGGAVRVRVGPRGGKVRLAVEDLGAGIPDEFRSRIFQKFAQADASNERRSAPGTGLGLSICKAIVDRLGGTIGFESEAGRGSTFWFEIPGAGAPDAAGPAVLVVDGNPAEAEALASACRRLGFQADVASGAVQARERLAARSYAAMTLDVRLPDADGLAFLREPRPAVPAIVVTAERQATGRFTGAESQVGIVDWLTKPVDHARFEAALRGIAAAVPAEVPEEPADVIRDFLRRSAPAGANR